MTTPQQARDTGIAKTLAANPASKLAVREGILWWVNAHPNAEYLTANELRPDLPGWVHRPVIGGVFATFMRRYSKPVGLESSTDVGTHGKPVYRWPITDELRAAAAQRYGRAIDQPATLF